MNSKLKSKITKKYITKDGLEILDIIILTDRSFSRYQKYSKKNCEKCQLWAKKR